MNILKQHLPLLLAAIIGGVIGAFLMGSFGGGGSASAPQSSSGFSFKGGGAAGEADCITSEEEVTVVGGSLTGVVENGEKVKVIKGYYACNDAKRGDIVVYNYSGTVDPIVKVVKAIPGDKLELKKSNDGWNVVVNGEIVKNSQRVPYLIAGNAYKILNLYVQDYARGGGVVTGGGHLILGNIPTGSLDSTSFGMVTKNDFIGKVKR
ncbi:MAG: signal peptidase I [Patescibacteria group bacterium]|nr:signal peptidase I [Patescibacteria group bacterium]